MNAALRRYNRLGWQAQRALQSAWEENHAAGNICSEHSHPEPCPVCREEVAADDRRAQLKDER